MSWPSQIPLSSSSPPLEGIRIVDISRALAGPYCTMILGDLGADVIKVERPESGDESRSWGPPFVGKPYGPYRGESTYFLATNRNKRSITVNLQTAEGQEIIRCLAAISDVLVENYRTGELDKFGLGYDEMHRLYPKLIYCSISGYGRSGPYAGRPGYDAIIQAEGGIMSLTGAVEGPPSRVGIPIIDIAAGMFAAIAILVALRAREQSGEGQHVDISLFDAHIALLTNAASNYLVGGEAPKRLGNAHPNIAPYEVFTAQDGWFMMGAANEHQWQRLCEIIGRPDLQQDPRFATNSQRVVHRAALVEELNHAFAQRKVQEWLHDLGNAGLPCAPINTLPQVFAHPQTQARQMVLEIEHPTASTIRLTGFPYKLSATPPVLHRPPPLLGQHTEEVLTTLLNYSPAEVATLREKKVI